jgi:hypothetical protein
VEKKYTRSLTDKTLKKIGEEIENEFPFPKQSTVANEDYISKLHDNIDHYVRKYMIEVIL